MNKLPTTDALLAAVKPIAAYVARTPAPNKHADKCAALVDAVADYVEEVELTQADRAAEPDWQALVYQMLRYVEPTTPPTPLMLRCQALLDSPANKTCATLPLAQRILLATTNSLDLGLPDHLQ